MTVLCLFLISNGAVASTNNGNKASTNGTNVNNNNNTNNSTNNNNNTESKSENVDPKMETTVTPQVEENQTEVANDGAIFIGQKPDSTSINSVSKFNFIFYFIYKLKYDEDPNGVGHMNYEF